MQTSGLARRVTSAGEQFIHFRCMNHDEEDAPISAEPLRKRLAGKHGEGARFARRLNISHARLTNWLRRGIPERQLPKVCAALGISVRDYLKEAGGRVTAEQRTPPYHSAPVEFVDIPLLDVAPSMGRGTAWPDQEAIVDQLRLSRNWVRGNLGVASAVTLSAICAYGDSMVPTFNSGDILIVDRGISDLRLDAVYVLTFHADLYIKRIQRRPDGSVAIISDNRVYDPIIVPAKEKDTVKVLGRVLWAWNGKRL